MSGTEPRIQRSVVLDFHADWGMANLHKIAGWLSQAVGERSGAQSRFRIHNGHGGFDAAFALKSREADVGLATPAVFARMAFEGTGPFDGQPMRDLRSLGVLPQWDRLVLAVDAQFGVRSFDELRSAQAPLAIAISSDDGCSHIGYAAMRIMEAAGIGRTVLDGWGGRYVERWRPDQCIALVRSGECSAVFQEAIMTPWWRELLAARPMHLLPIETSVLDTVARRYGWLPGDLPAGYFPGLDTAVSTLDYSDFILMVRADMPDDLAHLLTWCLVETRESLERQYRHIPRERSPVTYPLEPRCMARAPIPLHPGAQRYYDAAGHI